MQSVASMMASWVRTRLSFGQISTQMLQRLHHSSTHRMLTKSMIVGSRRGRLSAAYGVVVAGSPESVDTHLHGLRLVKSTESSAEALTGCGGARGAHPAEPR